MSEMYGFTIPVAGRRLLAKLLAGQTLEVTRTMVGTGKVAEGVNPAEFTDLVCPLAQASATLPTVKDMTVAFCVEYRSDMNGGLESGNYINEFGVFARDPDAGEVLLYYGNLGDFPQYVPAYSEKSVGVLRYPVSIALPQEGVEVAFAFDASAFMTAEEIAAYIAANSLPVFVEQAQAVVAAHDAERMAHPELHNVMSDMDARLALLELMYSTEVSGNPFTVTFGGLEGLDVSGVWNTAQNRIEF